MWLFEITMVGMGTEIAVPEKEGIIAAVSFFLAEAVREVGADMLRPALITIARFLFLACGLILHMPTSWMIEGRSS